jgi:hypothetical protein
MGQGGFFYKILNNRQINASTLLRGLGGVFRLSA